jgi:hypothetical protein
MVVEVGCRTLGLVGMDKGGVPTGYDAFASE